MNDRRTLDERLLSGSIGEEIFALAAEIYPICRSITGDGVRKTLQAIRSQSISRSMRSRPGPQSSTGSSRASGIFAMRISRTSEARRSSTSLGQICT